MRPGATAIILLGEVALWLSPLAHAQLVEKKADLAGVLRQHAMDLRLLDGQLAGAGADWLRQEAAQSQFFFIGEEHGVAEVWFFAGAAWRELVPMGYRHVALEISPRQGTKLERYARSGDAGALADYKAFALPQLPDTSVEALAFARQAGALARPRTPLVWGLEQEQRALPLFERLTELASNVAAKAAAEAAKEKARRAEASGQRIVSGYAAEIDAVREAFHPQPGSEGAQILDALELSNRLYEGQRSARTSFASNLEREEMLQRNFLGSYRAVQRAGEPKPKVMLVLGAWHGMRGFSPINIPSLGNFVADLARSEGSRMLNVLITCGRNGKRAGVDKDAGRVLPCGADEAEFFRPVIEAARSAWTLFDLRPLRPLVHAKMIDPGPELRPYIFAYDALLVIADTTPTRAESRDRASERRLKASSKPSIYENLTLSGPPLKAPASR